MTGPEDIQELANREYKYGFVTAIEADPIPAGLNEDVVRLHLAPRRTSRSGCSSGGCKAYRHWLTMTEPHWPNVQLPADRLPGHHLLLGAQARRRARRRASTRSIPSCSRPTRSSASRCSERELLAGVAVDAVFDSVSVATTFKAQAGRAGHHLLLVLRGGARAPGAGAEVPRLGRAATPTTSSPRSTRRSSATARSATSPRACAARWSCRPTSASTPPRPASSSAR